jgi:hypothetical protein
LSLNDLKDDEARREQSWVSVTTNGSKFAFHKRAIFFRVGNWRELSKFPFALGEVSLQVNDHFNVVYPPTANGVWGKTVYSLPKRNLRRLTVVINKPQRNSKLDNGPAMLG